MKKVKLGGICFLMLTICQHVMAFEEKKLLNELNEKNKIVFIEYEYFTDSTNSIHFNEVLSKTNWKTLPDIEKLALPAYTYWLRFKISSPDYEEAVLETDFLLNVELFSFKNGKYISESYSIGTSLGDKQMLIPRHAFNLFTNNTEYFYLKVKPNIYTGLGAMLHCNTIYVNEVILRHIYPIILFTVVFLLIIFNILFYIKMRESIYLYYTFFLICIMMFALVCFGYFSPLFGITHFKHWYYAIPYSFSSVFLILYFRSFLMVKENNKGLDKILIGSIVMRIFILGITIITDYPPQFFQWIDFICLLPILFAFRHNKGISKKTLALLFASYCFIQFGFLSNTFTTEYLMNQMPYILIRIFHYSGNFYFLFTLFEVIIFSYMMSQRFVEMKNNKEKEQQKTIEIQKIVIEKEIENSTLKENINKQLEIQVAERTQELQIANEALEEKAEEIKKMYDIIKEDNEKLTHDVELLQKARLLESNLSFAQFTETFEDEKAALQFIGDNKWKYGYKCKKCGYKGSYFIIEQRSRRCKLCSYYESALVSTIFDNTKFSPLKALYIVYATYYFKNLQVTALSEELELRAATCSAFQKKVVEAMKNLKVVKGQSQSWINLIFES